MKLVSAAVAVWHCMHACGLATMRALTCVEVEGSLVGGDVPHEGVEDAGDAVLGHGGALDAVVGHNQCC